MAARKSAIEIDFGVFEDLADQLEKLGADLKECFAEAMEKEGKNIRSSDTYRPPPYLRRWWYEYPYLRHMQQFCNHQVRYR